MTPEFIDDCIARALRHDSGLDAGVLDVPGFSTGTMRRLWNNLCALPGGGVTYLEVGAYFGGTACAAINNPDTLAYIYEDGSQEFHGRPILKELLPNLEKHGSDNWELRTSDFFANPVAQQDVDFFFYDGNHAREFQAKALPHAFPALADRFLFAVDDYRWHDVALGTAQGFEAVKDRMRIIQNWHLLGEHCHDDPVWHNGLALFLCEKI